jgi:hypothetical protein
MDYAGGGTEQNKARWYRFTGSRSRPAFSGLTLFAPMSGGGNIYLVDLDGKVIHRWLILQGTTVI